MRRVTWRPVCSRRRHTLTAIPTLDVHMAKPEQGPPRALTNTVRAGRREGEGVAAVRTPYGHYTPISDLRDMVVVHPVDDDGDDCRYVTDVQPAVAGAVLHHRVTLPQFNAGAVIDFEDHTSS
jgi:hypothetical protein